MPRLPETSEPKGLMENVNVKLRKSFSWDRSFFTNDGVLDAEEFSTMIEGGGKDVKQRLQGIEEKLCSSMESISTLENDNFALESLEGKFEETQVSTQKPSATSKLTNSSGKVSSREGDSQAEASSSSKQVALASEKRPATSTNIKGNPTSSRTSKTDSSSPNHVKDDHVTQKGRQTSKLTGVISPHRARPTTSLSSRLTSKLSSKLNFLRSSTPLKSDPPKSTPLSNSSGTKTSSSSNSKPPTPSSSSSSLSSSASSFTRKIMSRKKVDTKTNKPTDDSNVKTPSRIILKNKPPPVNSNLSGSSSSSSTGNQRSISRGSRGTSETHSTCRNLDRSGKQPPTQTGSFSRPRSVLSTGRGMPSTKTGLFDGGSSKRSTRNQTGSPKMDRNGNSNGAKSKKLPPLNSQKTNNTKTSKEQSKPKTRNSTSASRGPETIVVNSPEVLDIKGKINALRNEIGMQKIVSKKG